uniref:Uncharacterized protein n=1 Tax=Anguilla anguilla TaxID=7936 RepID=A0A0E9P5A8_ANGAN
MSWTQTRSGAGQFFRIFYESRSLSSLNPHMS